MKTTIDWSGVCDVGGSAIAEIVTSDKQKQQTKLQPIPPESLTGIAKWLYESVISY